MKLLAIFLLASGEALAIYAEMAGAEMFASRSFLRVFLKMFTLAAFAGGLLVLGYMFGFRAFKNIWVVSVVSITSILIAEPFLAYTIFHQLPTKGAAAGLAFAVLGFIAAVFF